MGEQREPAPVRLAELIAALSLGIDLGFGQPMEHVLRQCLIALRLCEFVDLDEDDRAVVYYTALLVNVGCHSDAHEQTRWFGDDISLRSTKYDHEPFSLRDTVGMLRRIGAGNPPLHRVRTGLEFAFAGRRDLDGMMARTRGLARALGEELGLPATVLDALAGSYERWDGRGWPGRRRRRRDPARGARRAARGVRRGRAPLRWRRRRAVVAEARAGKQFDPMLVSALCADIEKTFHGIDEVGSWSAVIDSEPALAIVLSPEECDAALLAIANFVDLKSPYTLGHSHAVAELAAAAGTQLGMPGDEVRALYRGGLVHDFGRLGVSNSIWDKRGPLGAGEWERVRMHPYFAERMLQQSETLAPLARDRGPASRAARRVGLPARAGRERDLACRACRGRGGRVPSDARTASVPFGTDAG